MRKNIGDLFVLAAIFALAVAIGSQLLGCSPKTCGPDDLSAAIENYKNAKEALEKMPFDQLDAADELIDALSDAADRLNRCQKIGSQK